MNEEIVEWLNKQQAWIRAAAHRVLVSTNIPDESIDEFVAAIKNPEKLTAPPKPYPKVNVADVASLRIDSIGPVVGIDAISPRKPLVFGKGNLAIVYGANGSGKSGYTRIISRACGKPHSVELKPNVYKDAPEKQECSFTYTLGGRQESATWTANAEPLAALESVDVFDTESGRLYLEKETNLSYEPPELTLFADLVKVCKRVEAKLLAEQSKLVCELPKLPTEHLATEAGKAYSDLSADIEATRLDALVTWTEADEAELQTQQQMQNFADPAAEIQRKRNEKKQIDTLRTTLGDAVAVLGVDSLDAIRQLAEESAACRKAAKEGATAMGGASQLAGIGGDTWKAMWAAARAYSMTDAYVGLEFPYTGDDSRCVLCHQTLDDGAKTRLGEFEAFVKGKLQTAAAKADELLEIRLETLPIRPDPMSVEASCQAAGLGPDVQAAVESVWRTLEKILTPLRSGTVPSEAHAIDEPVTKLLRDLADLSVAAEKTAAEIENNLENNDQQLTQKKRSESEGGKWVAQQADAVRAEVTRLKKIAQYDEWKKQTTTTGISSKAGEFSEQLITEAYIKRFNEELKKLGASKIQVDLVKTATSYGKSKHSIRLRDLAIEGTRPVEVLSEGENRIVSLAAFLADVTGRHSDSPFVFDDPISSLDQVFEEKVIARLIELSRDRQVLVFSHRLSFLGIMSDLAGGGLNDIQIRREPWGTGEPGEVPLFGKRPDKALNNLKGERLVKAKKVYANEGSEPYYIHGKSICSDFRILMERIVETVFLADVVQRHRRAVNTMGKIGNLVKITTSDCELIDQMMTKYSCYEHSQSSEAPVDVPEPDELEKDIEKMIDWHNEFSKRT